MSVIRIITGRVANVLALVFLFIALSNAWPWPVWEDSGAVLPLPAIRRAESKSATTGATTATSTAASAAATSATTGASATTSGGSSTSSGTITDSATSGGTATTGDSSATTGSGTITDKTNSRSGNSTSTTTKTSSISVDSDAAAGGVEMITPAATDGSQYYKVGDYVTFAWNYTSLSITPSAIDVMVSCSLNSATYTISSNMSVGETGSIVWDTGSTATLSNPYPVATYTLLIYDAATDPTAIASAGRLEAYDQYTFGMYTGQPYTPLSEWKCSTCSGALSIHERQLLGVVGVTALITLLSFTWFANGFGLLS